jgi:hypothetical protein
MPHTTIWNKSLCQFARCLALGAWTFPTTASASCRRKSQTLPRSLLSACMRTTCGSCLPALHQWRGGRPMSLANPFSVLFLRIALCVSICLCSLRVLTVYGNPIGALPEALVSHAVHSGLFCCAHVAPHEAQTHVRHCHSLDSSELKQVAFRQKMHSISSRDSEQSVERKTQSIYKTR